jgi:hypothetical protein
MTGRGPIEEPTRLSVLERRGLEASVRAVEHRLQHADSARSKSALLEHKAQLEARASSDRARCCDDHARALLDLAAGARDRDPENDDYLACSSDEKRRREHMRAARAAADVLHRSLTCSEASQAQVKAKEHYLSAGCEQHAEEAQARAHLLELTARSLHEIAGALEQMRVGKLHESR